MQYQTPRSPGYIYLMQVHPSYADWEDKSKGVYKIGLSSHPDQRELELNRGINPFLTIRMIKSWPVINMFDTEQKLHSLFGDKRIEDSEYFALYDHDLEALFAFVGQVDSVVSPQRKRRTPSYYKYDVEMDIPEDKKEVPLPSELESLIMAYIPHTRNRLSSKMRAYLEANVTVKGATWPSPESEWKDYPHFKDWVDKSLAWYSTTAHPTVEGAVYLIRNYGREFYGWDKFKDSGIRPIEIDEKKDSEEIRMDW